MTTLFISDLHLDPERPAISRLFENFLAGEARRAEALYILGDLFEAWVGDDDDSPLAEETARALSALAESGVPVYLMHGNRDFLIGDDYAGRCGAELLPDPTVIDLHGEPTLLMHGDTLCTDDVDYQRWREQAHSSEWQREFLSRPLAERRAFAAEARRQSREHQAGAKEAIMDVNPDAVVRTMKEHGVRRLIHGHTHRPAVHSLSLSGEPAERIVLGDWYEQGSVLRCDGSGCRLDTLPV
jgi:UDP-2,3-diacylglucosamine hydrolase